MITESHFQKFLWWPRMVEGRLRWLSTVWCKETVHTHIGGTFANRVYYRLPELS